ncbi:MAG: cytochrome c oxidase accessory protein CcoG [Sphingobacteriaceae bacterium]
METEYFRDHIPTVSKDGEHRQWMYPKLVVGKLYKLRSVLSWFFLALLFASPFIRINGEQMVLLNVLERKFVFFGVLFLPQDFHLFVLAMLTFMVFIVLFTVVFGRIWCGWACPQTIFMEMVFRKIEWWIEGDGEQQRRMNAASWTPKKIVKKGLKHFLFIALSFLIANTFLAYFIGSDQLFKISSEPIENHLIGFIAIWIFTTIFYLVFANLRELVCTVICPYGRLQGVLLDKQSLVVAYDYVRGEPRGNIKKGQENTFGDCVDCNLCVQVCPTGIDIRNGTQLECTNCTACIDACDMVMEKTHREKRLIGFNSEEFIRSGKKFTLNKRVYAYAAVLAVLVSITIYLLATRTPVETTVLRAGGTLYQERPDGTVSNLYNAEFVNKTSGDIAFSLESTDPNYKIQTITQERLIKRGDILKLTFFLITNPKHIKTYKSDVTLHIVSKNKVVDKVETTFIAPPGE